MIKPLIQTTFSIQSFDNLTDQYKANGQIDKFTLVESIKCRDIMSSVLICLISSE